MKNPANKSRLKLIKHIQEQTEAHKAHVNKTIFLSVFDNKIIN